MLAKIQIRRFGFVLPLFLLAVLLITAVGLTLNATPKSAQAAAEGDPTFWTDAGIAATSFGGGTGGSEADPYIISTGGHLGYLANQVNGGERYSGKFFKLSNDIDLSAHYFTAIGYYEIENADTRPFMGTFDGNGKVINNLTIDTDEACQGLFGYITGGATVKNLGIEKSSVKGGRYTGGVVGYIHYSTGVVTNCYYTGEVFGSGEYFTGGIVGYLMTGVVTNCYNAGDITGGQDYTGGVAGYIGSSGTSGTSDVINYYSWLPDAKGLHL